MCMGTPLFSCVSIEKLAAVDQACLVEPASMPRVLRNQNKNLQLPEIAALGRSQLVAHFFVLDI